MVSPTTSARWLGAIVAAAAVLTIVQIAADAPGSTLDAVLYPVMIALIIIQIAIYVWTWRLIAPGPGASYVLAGAILRLPQFLRVLSPLPAIAQQPVVLGLFQGAMLLAPFFFAAGLLRSRLVPRGVSWLYVAAILSAPLTGVLGGTSLPVTQLVLIAFLASYAFFLIRPEGPVAAPDARSSIAAAAEQARPADSGLR